MISPLTLPDIFVQDFGSIMAFHIKRSPSQNFDVSSAISLVLKFRRPDRTTFERGATKAPSEDSTLEDGADGRVFYITQANDFTIGGEYNVQLTVTLPEGRWSTSFVTFIVFPHL